MITFLAANIWFKRAGLLLLCANLLLFVFCLYPFQFGTWFNTEPAMVALFSLATLSVLWFGMGIGSGWLVLERPVHPLVYGLLAWAGWQFLSLPMAQNPLHSWMGLAQTGEGGAWQVMLVLLTLVAMPLWKPLVYKKILLIVGVFSLCVMTYLHFDPVVFCRSCANYIENNPETPANFPDYLVFIAGYLWISFASTPSLRTPSHYFWMISIFSAVLFTTFNHSARFFLVPMVLATTVMLFVQFLRRKPEWLAEMAAPSKVWKIIAIIGIFLPLVWVVISQQQELFPNKNSSLASHAVFNQVAISALVHEPLRLIFGNGWGVFGNDMFTFGMVEGVFGFVNGNYAPNFEWLAGNVFHPHNQPMAALLALGVVGFLLFMALPVLAILPLRRSLFWWCVPVVLGINATALTWFTIPQVLPFQALAFAALCAGRAAKIREFILLPRWFSGVCLALALLLAISGWQQLNAIFYGERLAAIMGEDPNQAQEVEFMAEDIARGGDRLIAGLTHYAEKISRKVSRQEATNRDRDWYRNFLAVAHIGATSPYANARLAKLEVELSMLPFRLMQASPLDDLKPQIKENLVDAIVRLTSFAPEREDFIAPFLISLDGVTGGDVYKQVEILKRILTTAPNHRSALWLLGGIYQTSSNPNIREQGAQMKTRSLELGVERVFPVY